ncbi:MAG: ABC transporter permease subunit [Clostridia bacterium]|nr:ABC transporter permease subunit [Clostridia bacterium]
MKKLLQRIMVLSFAVFLIVFIITQAAPSEIKSLDDLKGKRIGFITGKTFESHISEVIEDPQKRYYNSYSDLLAALKSGNIDAIMCDEPTARAMCRDSDGVRFLCNTSIETEYVFAFADTPDGDALCSEFNEYLLQIKNNGTLNEIADIWFGYDESKKELEFEEFKDARTLSFASNAETPPFIYEKDEKLAGYEADILNRFCKAHGYNFKYSTMPFSSILQSFQTGQTDIAADVITVTDERGDKLKFSAPDFHGNISVVVKDENATKTTIGIANITQGLKNNFATEDRWKLIVSGICITLLISCLSAVFGAGFGFLLLMLLRCRYKLLRYITTAFIKVIQGVPIIILLMILFYIVFVRTPLPPVGVAAAAFSINFGTTVASVMNTSINAVHPGQTEAALAMGYTPSQTLFKILMPQAAQHFMPILKSAFVSLVKTTSIVGYIAIGDLTKATDVIRSRTYEAFFPLLLTAAIYFILSWLLTLLLSRIEIKFDPKRRTNKLKGVVTNGSNDQNS